MARKSGKQLRSSVSKHDRSHAGHAERGRSHAPDWPLLAVGLAGLVLTGYLTYAAWSAQSLAYCSAGSGCDLVQTSRWAVFLGLPIAFWGFLTYLALAGLAIYRHSLLKRYRLALAVAVIGIAVSLYLNVVSFFVIQAFCAYCLVSLALITAATVRLLVWPYPVAQMRRGSWVGQSIAAAGAILIFMHVYYGGAFDSSAGPEEPYLRSLAEHLRDSGARFFGAAWCDHCRQQKMQFGASADRLPYVECAPNGRNGPPATVCLQENVNTFPTWIINGKRYSQLLAPAELARISRFAGTDTGAP